MRGHEQKERPSNGWTLKSIETSCLLSILTGRAESSAQRMPESSSQHVLGHEPNLPTHSSSNGSKGSYGCVG